MKMYELQKLTREIEETTNRKIKLLGTTCTGKPAVFLYFNDWLVHTYFLDELYHEINTLSFVINGLAFGKNPVEF